MEDIPTHPTTNSANATSTTAPGEGFSPPVVSPGVPPSHYSDVVADAHHAASAAASAAYDKTFAATRPARDAAKKEPKP